MTTESGTRKSDDGTGDSTTDEYEAHLERSRRVWNRWSDWYGMSERDLEPIREAAIDRLNLRRGDRVLEIGCGPGVNLERIRSDIGESGVLVAVDYSPEMVEKARERIERHGWENVEVRRVDATTAGFDEPFDAAIATLALSIMPDVHRATENVYGALAPGGRFAVVDLRPIPTGPARVLNPLLWRFVRWYANWNPDGDVVGSLEAVFDTHEIVDTDVLGTTYTVVCEKRDEP